MCRVAWPGIDVDKAGDRFKNETHTWTDRNDKDAQILGDNKVSQI
jgi:hypothetical protein